MFGTRREPNTFRKQMFSVANNVFSTIKKKKERKHKRTCIQMCTNTHTNIYDGIIDSFAHIIYVWMRESLGNYRFSEGWGKMYSLYFQKSSFFNVGIMITFFIIYSTYIYIYIYILYSYRYIYIYIYIYLYIYI